MPQREEETWLSVTEEPSDLAAISQQCREVTQRRAQAVIDAIPEFRGYISLDSVETLARDKDSSIFRLKKITSSRVVDRAGLNAAIFLCRLLHPEGLPYLRKAIEEGNEELRAHALKGIGDSLIVDNDRATTQGDFWLSDNLLLGAVLHQLHHPSEKVVDEAVTVCGKLRLEKARERLLELARNPGKVNLGSVFHWLCKWPLSDELLEVGIEAARASIGTKFRQTCVIREAARSPDPEVRTRAKVELQRQLDNWPCGNDYAHLGYRPQVAAAAAECCTVADLPWLRKRVDEDSGWSVKELLRALVRLEGSAGVNSLKAAIHGNRHRADALSIAGELFKNSASDELTREIASVIFNLTGDELAAACQALVEIGGRDAINAARPNFERLATWRRAQIEAQIDGPSLEEIVLAVTEAGIIDESAANSIRSALAKNEILLAQNRKPRLIDVLSEAGIVVWFDVETDELPCRHDRLVERFAKASKGAFSPDAVSEQWHREKEDDFDAEYTLRFIYARRGYIGRIRNFGDWYDVERTVTLVNRGLADAGVAERTTPLIAVISRRF